MGARFAKWRAVITIGEGLPTDKNLMENADGLALYARACQEADIVPIVEPEVLMDGSHSQEMCKTVSMRTLKAVFESLGRAGVVYDGMILKTNMIVQGTESGMKATPEEVAMETVAVFKDCLPNELPGQAFLSGGQSEIDATKNLNAIGQTGKLPWAMTFSFGRALQDSALKTWAGERQNFPQAQAALVHRAKMNSLATRGMYTGENA